MNFKITDKNGARLNTAQKYCEEDIIVTIDESVFSDIGFEKYNGSYLEINDDINITLPSDYHLLNYIESNGNQFIDTEYIMTTDSEIEIQLEPITYNTSAKMGFLGSYETNIMYQLYASGSGNKMFYSTFGGKTYISTMEYSVGAKYNISMNSNSIMINTYKYTYNVETINDATKSLYLFYRNDTGAKAEMKLYYCKIYKRDTLMRHFVPCLRREDSVVGLYDLVNNKFYASNTSDGFIGG